MPNKLTRYGIRLQPVDGVWGHVMIKVLDGEFVKYEDYAALEKERDAACENWQKQCASIQQKLDAAEAQLAELEKQEPVAWCPKTQIDLLSKHRMVEADLSSMQRFDEVPLFTRPAPAINLAELVPPEADGSNLPFAAEGWNACRAAILRSIEAAK